MMIKQHYTFLFPLIIGAFLRFFRIRENIYFDGELGHNYLAIKNFISAGIIPLIGPPTSHTWLSFGPLYYWIFGPILALGGYEPIIGSYFFALIGIVTICVNFYVVKKLFDEKTAFFSSFLAAVSPSWLFLTRQARFFSLILPLSYLYLLFLTYSISKNTRYLFWTGIILGIMLNFHFSPLILIPGTILVLYFYRSSFSLKNYAQGCLGVFIPNIPLLLYDFFHGFSMTRQLVLWIPYRIFGFVGLYPKNTADQTIISGNISSLFTFISNSFLAIQGITLISMIIGSALLLFLILRSRFISKSSAEKKVWHVILALSVIGYIGIFLHGNPPYHYYLPLYPFPILCASLALVYLWKKYKLITITLLGVLAVTNLLFYFSEKWFFIPQIKQANSAVPYSLQNSIVQTVINDVDGKKFSLKRVGPLDQFEGNYAQNYQYLLWLSGNEPVPKAQIEYTIFELEESVTVKKTYE